MALSFGLSLVSQAITAGGATLNLQFAGATAIDSRITFTRASSATFTGSNGLLQTAAVDAPRLTYNPTTLAAEGLLVEEQRTNLLLNTSVLVTQVVTVTAVTHTLSFYGAGTVVLSGAATGTVVGTGAYPTRTTLIFTPIVGVLTVTVTGSVTSAQLEAGAFATSYIPTTTAQATRAADVAVMTGTNFSSWYNQSEGTFVAVYQRIASSLSGVLAANDNTAANKVELRGSPVADSQMVVRTASVGQVLINLGTFVANTVTSTAISYKQDDFIASQNGVNSAPDTLGTLPVVTQMRIGAIDSGTNTLNGNIKAIVYYPRRLTNTELQALTLS